MASTGVVASYFISLGAQTPSGVIVTEPEINAYLDGNLYLSTSKNNGLYSACQPDIAYEYLFENNIDSSFIFDCSEKKTVETDDGTKLICSSYSDEAIDKILSEMGLEQLGLSIADARTEVVYTDDFLIKEFVYSVLFDDSDNVFSLKMTFLDYNEATFDVERLKIINYSEIDDITLLIKGENILEELLEKREGKFEMEVIQDYTASGHSVNTCERDVITYGENQNGFFYRIEGYLDDVYFYVNYKNGVLNSNGTNSEITDEEAWSTVKALLNTVKYDRSRATDVRYIKKNVFRINHYIDAGAGLKNYVTSTFTLVDDRVSKIECIVSYGKGTGIDGRTTINYKFDLE